MTTSMRASLTICIAFLLALIAAFALTLPNAGVIGKFGVQTAWAETGGLPDGEGAPSDECVASVTTNGVVEYYTSSSKAIFDWRTVNASDSKTLTLLSDIEWSAMNNIAIPPSGSDASQYPDVVRTLDLNGFVFDSTRSIDLRDVKLVVKDGSASGQGELCVGANAIYCYECSEVVIESGTVRSETSSAICVAKGDCSVAVNGGAVLSAGGHAIFVDNELSNVSISVNDGTLSSVRSGQFSKSAIRALDGVSVVVNGGTISSEEDDTIVARSLTVTGDPTIIGSVYYGDDSKKIDLTGYMGLGLSIDFQSAYKREGTSVDKVQIPDGYGFYQGDTELKTISADSIVTVEPYHAHDWEYSVEGNKITATCKGKRVCPEGGVIVVTLNVPAPSPYDGQDRVADVSVSQVVASSQKPTAFFDVNKDKVVYHACSSDGTPQSSVNKIVDAGTYAASLTLGDVTAVANVEVEAVHISTFSVKSISSQVYAGEEIKPPVSFSGSIVSGDSTIRYGNEEKGNVLDAPLARAGDALDVLLVQGEDFSVSYQDNVNAGSANVIITGMGNYKGKLEASFEITPRVLTIADATVEGKVYDGTAKATVGSVTLSGLALTEMLVPGEDFVATAEFLDANVGNDKDALVTISLKKTALASNYVLLNDEFMTKGQIIQAAGGAFAGSLTVLNGKEAEYRIDLAEHIPERYLQDKDMAVSIEIVDIADGYYDAAADSARLVGTALVLPIQKVDSDAESAIGSVEVKISSWNYEPSTFTVEVSSANDPAPAGSADDAIAPTGDSLPTRLAVVAFVTMVSAAVAAFGIRRYLRCPTR